jgi:hypothetical protein
MVGRGLEGALTCKLLHRMAPYQELPRPKAPCCVCSIQRRHLGLNGMEWEAESKPARGLVDESYRCEHYQGNKHPHSVLS